MCCQLGLQAKQAAALLTGNSKYFTHMLQKGVSGKFDFAQPMYSHLVQHTALLSELMHKNTQTIPFVLNLLVAGFGSEHPESCQWICRVFTRLAAQLSALGDGRVVNQWLVQPKNIGAVMKCYER